MLWYDPIKDRLGLPSPLANTRARAHAHTQFPHQNEPTHFINTSSYTNTTSGSWTGFLHSLAQPATVPFVILPLGYPLEASHTHLSSEVQGRASVGIPKISAGALI